MARILIVDDARFVRAVLERTLRRAGHKVESACDGLEALHQLELAHYDLVMLDLSMPVLDGFGLLNQMSLLGYESKTIAMTGGSFTDTRDLCRELGVDGYLTKPAYGEELLALVNGVLGASPAQDQLSV